MSATRRELIHRAVAGGALAGLTGGLLTRAAATAAGSTPDESTPDVQQARQMLAVELVGIAVYERVLSSGHLGARGRQLARRLLGQDHAHARALRRLLGPDAGGISAPATTNGIDEALTALHVNRAIEDLHDEHDCLDMLLDVEQISEGTYYAAMPKLEGSELILLATQLLASDGQHQALLGQLRDPKDLGTAVPYPFVEGIS